MTKAANHVKTISILLMVFGGLAFFTNTMAAAMTKFMGILEGSSDGDPESISDWIMQNFTLFYMLMAFLGLNYLIGGYHLMKYKEWSRKYVLFLLVLSMLIIWSMIIDIVRVIPTSEMWFIQLGGILGGAFWSIPHILLIRYFIKSEIKASFS